MFRFAQQIAALSLIFSAINWMTDPFWTKVALIMIQGWLGFPYIYVLVTGSYNRSQMISMKLRDDRRCYSAPKRFNNITLPAIPSFAAPTFVTQYTFNSQYFLDHPSIQRRWAGDVGGGAAIPIS